MKKNRSNLGPAAKIFGFLMKRPHTIPELAGEIYTVANSYSMGRVYFVINELIESDAVTPMLIKNQLFFKLKEPKYGSGPEK